MADDEIKAESDLLRHILTYSQYDGRHESLILIDSGWIALTPEQMAVWDRLIAEV